VSEKSIKGMQTNFFDSVLKQYAYYKMLGEKVFDQLNDEQLFWQPNPESNSISTIVKHLWGNMLSRWTDFLHTDGEKAWRNRDAEFENDIRSRKEMIEKWESGWKCVFNALNAAKEVDLSTIVYIRNQGHTILEVIHRQLAHYAYHIGQIVHIGKSLKGTDWQTLSIPRGKSDEFNHTHFAKGQHRAHFTDEFLPPTSE
jgi:hypothetical protein